MLNNIFLFKLKKKSHIIKSNNHDTQNSTHTLRAFELERNFFSFFQIVTINFE